MPDPATPTAEPAAPVIPYASPPVARARISLRGAVITLLVGAGFLVMTMVLIGIAWSMYSHLAEMSRTRSSDALEVLGGVVAFLACLSFLLGVVIVFMGLRGVRDRETTTA